MSALILFFCVWAVFMVLAVLSVGLTPTTVRVEGKEWRGYIIWTGIFAAFATLLIQGVISLFF